MSRTTKSEVIEMLEKVVKDREDYVYQFPKVDGHEVVDCVYTTPEGQPSCIVGHVLHDFKPEYFGKVHEEEYTETGGGYTKVHTVGVSYLPGIHLEFSDEAVGVLSAAQRAQDWGETWGDAVTNANRG